MAASDLATPQIPLSPNVAGSVSTTNVVSPAQAHEITLITGDVLVVTPQDNGRFGVVINAAPRSTSQVVFQTITDSKEGTFVIPSDVRVLLPNILDPTFFNINYLVSHHLTDDQTPNVNAIVQYASDAPMNDHWGPSVISSSYLSSIHSQTITIPKKHAADFGKILLDPNAAHSLAGIQKIWLDRVFTASDDQSGPLIGAVYARNVLGYNGSGIKIAIIDTGIDNTHPDFFFPHGSSKIIINADYECSGQAFDPSICDGTTHDLFGHGTHVAGIAAGTGAASSGLYIGIAPGAMLMNVKALNRLGFGYDSWIIPAMQAAANGINGTKADVISMSLGDGITDGTDPLSQAVNSLSASTGVVFVIAAGNSGSGEVTVAAPGAATAAITAAASTKFEPVSIAYFSSRGPRSGDFNIKPDITAPGVDIISTCSSTATVLTCPSGSRYLTLSGTSMATPHVSGSVALLLQAARASGVTLTPAQVKNLIQDSSRILQPATGQPDVDIYQQGAGLVRIDRAITSNITFTPAEMSFGLVPFNTTSTLTRTFQITNRGRTSQTLYLNWTMYDVPSNLSPASTGASFTSLVSLDKTSLTLSSGASANVTLTINAPGAPSQKLYSFFSGRIVTTITTGEKEHAIFGFTKEGPRQTLKITGIMANGSPAASQYYSIFDANDSLGLASFFHTLDSNGQANLRVPPSNYNIIMDIIFPGGLLDYYRITATEVRVAATPVSVVLDARTAGPVTLNLQANPKATNGPAQTSTLMYFRPDGSSIGEINLLLGANWDLFATNNDTAHLGTLWSHDRWERDLTPSETSPVYYDLTLTRKQQGPVVHTVTNSTLAATTGIDNTRLYADLQGRKLLGRFDFPTAFPLFFGITADHPINASIIQQYYLQANQDLYWPIYFPDSCFASCNGFFLFSSAYYTNYFGILLPGKIWAPGETLIEPWTQQPVHPTVTGATRSGNTLLLSGFEVVDNFGHPGLGINYRGANFTLQVYVNGISSLATNFFPNVAIGLPSTGTATVKIVMNMNPDPAWASLARTTQTNVTFTTSPNSQGALPLPNPRYAISSLDIFNKIPRDGNATKLTFTIPLTTPTGALFNATSASVMYSTDDGTTWLKMVTFISPGLLTPKATVSTTTPTTYVSLLVHAQSADGTVLDQKIIRAIQIVQGAAPPPP